jgi:translation initiation factor 4B
VRPKLNLQKRTVSEAETAAPAARSADSKSSPFGAARPIDTAAREREIEEKRQLAIRQKKEADEKTKAEKAEKQRVAKEQAKTEKAAGDANGSKEGGADVPQSGKNFEILRRASEDENGTTADNEAEEKTEEGSNEASKEAAASKPASKTNENWRRGPAPTAEADDNEGWSTVGTKQRNNRRGQSGRAFQ